MLWSLIKFMKCKNSTTHSNVYRYRDEWGGVSGKHFCICSENHLYLEMRKKWMDNNPSYSFTVYDSSYMNFWKGYIYMYNRSFDTHPTWKKSGQTNEFKIPVKPNKKSFLPDIHFVQPFKINYFQSISKHSTFYYSNFIKVSSQIVKP